MPTLRPGSPVRLHLAIGQSVTITADAGSIGAVTGSSGKAVPIKPGAPLKIGRPGDYLIEADTGSLAYEVHEPLIGALDKGTRNLQSARVIQHAIIEGQKMALSDKFARLAQRTKDVPAALDQAAEKALAGFDQVEQRGDAALAKVASIVSDANAAVAVAEDAVNQLTNGAPA